MVVRAYQYVNHNTGTRNKQFTVQADLKFRTPRAKVSQQREDIRFSGVELCCGLLVVQDEFVFDGRINARCHSAYKCSLLLQQLL